MKTCSSCRQPLPPSSFNRSVAQKDGLQGKCRDCSAVASKVYRLADPEKTKTRDAVYHATYYRSNREKVVARVTADRLAHPEEARLMGRARSAVFLALKNGRLVKPSTCEACGTDNLTITAAHHDYSRPLDVRWLCRSCHARWDHAQPKVFGKRAAQTED